MANASRTFVCFSAASFTPRSAKTLPELRRTFAPRLLLAMPALIVCLRRSQSPGNQVDFRLWCLDRSRRFLLERMQQINGVFKSYRVNRPVGVSPMIVDNFEYAWPHAFPRLCLWVLPAELRHAQCDADLASNILRKAQQIPPGRTD